MARHTVSTLARLFAALPFGSEESGKAASLSFQGDKAYSYAAVIAVKVSPHQVIVTTTKYSNTTSKHTSEIRSRMSEMDWQVVDLDLNTLGLPKATEGKSFPGWKKFLAKK